MRSAELFAGCGGLALGMSRAGFTHEIMAEFNRDAVATVLHNRALGVEHVNSWPMRLQDVRDLKWCLEDELDVVSGGPPCQPFGIGGKKLGQDDHRDMWPEAIRAVREARPKAFLFENVRNLAGPRFNGYLDWITVHLSRPRETRFSGETLIAHRDRLAASEQPADYTVGWRVVNAADFGAAQIRHRVLIHGIRSDLGITAKPLLATHSRDRLLWDQHVTGEYWARHGLTARPLTPSRRDLPRVEHLRKGTSAPEGLAWVTVRDALAGLGEPTGRGNHVPQPGAKVYPGHTGSPLDMPAKALKAGDHGVPGGENMMVRDDGSVRYFTTREAARLVGMSDDFEFPRSWTESMRQLGNAVPAPLATAAGRWLAETLGAAEAGGLASRRMAA